jgi:hypothetical protein
MFIVLVVLSIPNRTDEAMSNVRRNKHPILGNGISSGDVGVASGSYGLSSPFRGDSIAANSDSWVKPRSFDNACDKKKKKKKASAIIASPNATLTYQ